jgi:cytosine/adenosine deaminase-related metal-dependent hydrolase
MDSAPCHCRKASPVRRAGGWGIVQLRWSATGCSSRGVTTRNAVYDQLLSLAMAARFSPEAIIADIKLARSLGVRTTIHATNAGLVAALDKAGVMGPDLTYVHTIGIEATDDEYRMIAASGSTISSSSATEMMSGHGFPSAQRWSVDREGEPRRSRQV